MPARLNVNIDHVATVRQARRAPEPSIVAAAMICEQAGADGITVHLRGDRRHIQDADLFVLRPAVTTYLNVEMAATEEMMKIAIEVKPEAVSLVPENPGVDDGEINLKPERGVETLFRVTARKQLDLTTMADSKANLIIGVNTIIISIVISVIGTRLSGASHLLIPSILIILTNATTIVIAILATRPKIIRVSDHIPGKESAEFNILFFGHFSRMSLDSYKETIRKTIMKKDDIYDTMSRDIYYQGLILSKKYSYIAWAYTIFVIGLVISILAFITAFILHS